jgi:phosphoglycerate dehydrogenase-like enzyme
MYERILRGNSLGLMKFWKNTATLDHLIPELLVTVDSSEAELAVIGSKPINLTEMPNLKAIFKCGVGVDNIPFVEAKERGIQVILPSEKTKSYIFEETANFAVHLILLMLYKDLGSVEDWAKNEREFLGQKKVLVLGLGNIGRQVAIKLNTMAKVLTFDPLENTENELKGLFNQADAISLHMPLVENTKAFVNAEKLSWMKDGAALINTARGPIVEEQALYNEIKKNRVFAAFDVFWMEPYEGILCEFHPNRFFMTPHVASNCSTFLEGLAFDFRSYLALI